MTDFRASGPDQSRPDFAAFAGSWSRTRLVPVAPPDPRLLALARTMAATCNLTNGIRFAQFRIDADPELADYFAHNRIEPGFFRHFFTHPDVRKAFPGLLDPRQDPLGFCRETGPEMTAMLERAVLNGGAYRSFKGSEADARKLVADFTTALGDRLATAGGWLSEDAWNPWFRDVAWDRSFFWFDRGTSIATVLLTTDTD